MGEELCTEFGAGYRLVQSCECFFGLVHAYNERFIDEQAIEFHQRFSSLLTNVGQMRNTGVELEVRSNNIKTKDFSWTTAFNLSHNKNKILKLADLPWFVDGRYVRKEGYPFNTIYLREYAGWILRLEVPCIMITNRMRMAIIPKIK